METNAASSATVARDNASLLNKNESNHIPTPRKTGFDLHSTTEDQHSFATDLQSLDSTGDDDEHKFSNEFFGSGQDILDWPVFENKYDRRYIEALIFDPTLPCDFSKDSCTSPQVADDSIRDRFEDPRQRLGIGAGICEDHVPSLVETFLVNVHVKNPILDPGYLRNMARGVVEHGFDWKASSCLVVGAHLRNFVFLPSLTGHS